MGIINCLLEEKSLIKVWTILSEFIGIYLFCVSHVDCNNKTYGKGYGIKWGAIETCWKCFESDFGTKYSFCIPQPWMDHCGNIYISSSEENLDLNKEHGLFDCPMQILYFL